MKQIDCRGMACPQPVISTKDYIQEHPREIVEILVDNKASKENVCRFLKSQNWTASVKMIDEETYSITAAPPTCDIDFKTEEAHPEPQSSQKILVFIPADIFGSGSEELGRGLMKNFISTLKEMGKELWRIVLVNGGVKLSAKDSPVLDDLKNLEEAGVSILVCGTCLEYFKLLDSKAVGETTNMLDIVTSMQVATKIIRI